MTRPGHPEGGTPPSLQEALEGTYVSPEETEALQRIMGNALRRSGVEVGEAVDYKGHPGETLAEGLARTELTPGEVDALAALDSPDYLF